MITWIIGLNKNNVSIQLLEVYISALMYETCNEINEQCKIILTTDNNRFTYL